MKKYLTLIILLITFGLGCEIRVDDTLRKNINDIFYKGFEKGIYCVELVTNRGQPLEDCYKVLEILKNESN